MLKGTISPITITTFEKIFKDVELLTIKVLNVEKTMKVKPYKYKNRISMKCTIKELIEKRIRPCIGDHEVEIYHPQHNGPVPSFIKIYELFQLEY